MALTLPLLSNLQKPAQTQSKPAASSPPRVPYNNGLYAGAYNPSIPVIQAAPQTVTPAAPVDPYSGTPFGSTDNYNKVRADYDAQKNNTFGSIDDRIGTDASSYHSGILDYLDSANAGQKVLDERGVQNELARQQGSRGILESVGRGIRSGGVVLNNKGASTSSATDALARAYGDIGQRQMGEVGNEFAQDERQLGLDQDAFGAQLAQGARHLSENKTNIVNGIVSDAQSAISKLNENAASASLPDRINIEAEKQRIRDQALSKLQGFDAEISKGQSVRPQDRSAVSAQAASLMSAGTAAANPYEYTSDVPLQFQGTGPFASELPLFTRPKRR